LTNALAQADRRYRILGDLMVEQDEPRIGAIP
jgi:hypothetical protein